MSLNNFLHSTNGKWLAGAVAALALALLIFHAGYVAGSRRFVQGERGEHTFGVFLPHGFVAGGHGAVGDVQSYTPPMLRITTRDGEAESVVVGTSTVLEPPGATSTKLAPGARVIIIGTPGAAGLQAKIIRVVPTPKQ